jgi:hypothetical protein
MRFAIRLGVLTHHLMSSILPALQLAELGGAFDIPPGDRFQSKRGITSRAFGQS